MELGSIFVSRRETLSFWLSFTSGIPDCRRYDIREDRIFAFIESSVECLPTSHHPLWLTDRSGVGRRQEVRLLGSQTHVLHPKGVEHIPQHRLFIRREITRGLAFQDREQ